MSGAQVQDQAGTKRALIDAASSLFAEQGFDAVSLREITGRAGANVASVKYHFGSKDELIDAVVVEMVRPVNEERLRRISELEKSERPTVRALLEAFFEPMISQMISCELGEQLFCKLMGRLAGERPYEFPTPVMTQFREVAGRFVPAFGKALPGLSAEEIFWRIHFSFGVMSNTLMHGDLLAQVSGGLVKRETMEETMERVINFCEAGFMKEGKR
ncbi:MAG: TetR/AcrR family transcriptional regulator [Verrucomicrobiaceae bacterium]